MPKAVLTDKTNVPDSTIQYHPEDKISAQEKKRPPKASESVPIFALFKHLTHFVGELWN